MLRTMLMSTLCCSRRGVTAQFWRGCGNVTKAKVAINSSVKTTENALNNEKVQESALTSSAKTSENVPKEEEVQETVSEEHYQQHVIYKSEGPASIHLNMDDLTNELQTEFVKSYLEELKRPDVNLQSIYFNFINEDVYKYHLNGQLRRIGYTSFYQRYNHGRGLAGFERVNPDDGYRAVNYGVLLPDTSTVNQNVALLMK